MSHKAKCIIPLMYVQLFLFIFFNTSELNAQTNKHWCNLGPGILCLGNFNDSLHIYPPSKDYSHLNMASWSFTMSSFNGDLLFLGDEYRIYDNTGSPLKNSEKLYIPEGNMVMQTGENTWDILGKYFYDSFVNLSGPFSHAKNISDEFCRRSNCFDSFMHYRNGFYRTQIRRDKDNRLYINEKMKLLDGQLPAGKSAFLDIKRIKDYEYNLLSFSYKGLSVGSGPQEFVLFLLSYKDGHLSLSDSMVFNGNDYGGSVYFSFAQLSRNRDRIYVSFFVQKGTYKKTIFKELIINPLSGKISSVKILADNSIVTTTTDTIISFGGTPYQQQLVYNSFSPDDNILYLHHSKIHYLKGEHNKDVRKILAWRFRQEPLSSAQTLIDNSKENISENTTADINPYGGLTMFIWDESKKERHYYHIADANRPFISKTNTQILSKTENLTSIVYPRSFGYDYIRVKDSVRYKDCKAHVKLENKSDLSNGLSKFKWYLAKDSAWTEWDSFDLFEMPAKTYTTSGKYLFKLHATSIKGSGYSEWYVDTLKIEIPARPDINFYASDTIICQHIGMQFHNYSHAKDSIKNSYNWDFGDGGRSSAKNPAHVYTKPGTFTVKLTYNNGYCDTFMVKNQYIRIVDAPKSGFTVDQKQGCTPFNVAFTDTVTINVRLKDYYFSDTKTWENIPLDQTTFTHTFHKPGIYRTVQRLTGFTSCIIQIDSVFLNISKGLTNEDTLHILNSTVLGKKALLWWPQQDGAVSYRVYKDNQPYSSTTDTFLHDQKLYEGDATYTVEGEDSCGTLSSKGRPGKPIFLQAVISGNNETALISFSLYLQWQGHDIKYQVQKWQNGTWTDIHASNTNDDYTDLQFLDKRQTETCYRIRALESSNPVLLSHSNEVCVPYIPTIFIPESFSPNGDGINDLYEPVMLGIKSYTMTVFNRWGEMIFTGNEAWNGGKAPQDVYMVMIHYTTGQGTKFTQSLSVTLLR
jgi:gliding motility-associated-like protein